MQRFTGEIRRFSEEIGSQIPPNTSTFKRHSL